MRSAFLLAAMAVASCHAPRLGTSPPPGDATYAWMRFDAAQLRSGKAAGVADRATRRAVTLDDPVRVASVSKLVVALGVMRLVEQGKLDLDEDVSRQLGWRLRNPGWPDAPITLRMLLSHTSSLDDAGEAYLVPLGDTLEAAIAKNAVFDRRHRPGSYFRYANLNFPVIAAVMEQAAGERFDRLIHRLVMAPLALDACFNWTMCSDSKVARAVTLYRPDGSIAVDDLRGQRPACPVFRRGSGCDLAGYRLGTNGAIFSPQGGFRASVRDLAIIGQLLLNHGRRQGRTFLTPASIDAILTPVWNHDGTNGDTTGGFYCAYGLAAQSLPIDAPGCRDDLFAGRAMAGHAGEAYNLYSGLWIDRRRKVGIAFFAANNPADPPPARTAYTAIEEWLAAKLGD